VRGLSDSGELFERDPRDSPRARSARIADTTACVSGRNGRSAPSGDPTHCPRRPPAAPVERLAERTSGGHRHLQVIVIERARKQPHPTRKLGPSEVRSTETLKTKASISSSSIALKPPPSWTNGCAAIPRSARKLSDLDTTVAPTRRPGRSRTPRTVPLSPSRVSEVVMAAVRMAQIHCDFVREWGSHRRSLVYRPPRITRQRESLQEDEEARDRVEARSARWRSP
jgi:hypothetical protein